MSVKNSIEDPAPGLLTRIVLYARVSTDDQRDRHTVETQLNVMREAVKLDPSVHKIGEYVDEGISGVTPMSKRPEGGRLLRDAERHIFDQVWVYRFDRISRDDVDPLLVVRNLEDLGIEVKSVTEGETDPFMLHIRVAVAADERRAIRARSMAGMERAVKEGRYTGGIVSYGYVVEGERDSGRLVPDQTIAWGDLSAADVIRWIFKMAGEQAFSTIRIADELNDQGVPTKYLRDGREVKRRGHRKKKTQGTWSPGRILQILNNTTYRGVYEYGKRPGKGRRNLITGKVPRLVSDEVWFAAQEILSTRARVPHEKRRKYLLRSKLKCSDCGLNYSGSVSHGSVWYRCNGQLKGRGSFAGRCPAKGVKGQPLENAIWDDIKTWLINPDEILETLRKEMEKESPTAALDGELATITAALSDAESKRDRLLDLYLDGTVPKDQLASRMELSQNECETLSQKIGEIQAKRFRQQEPHNVDLLTQLRHRLQQGVDDGLMLELFQLLVDNIVVQTTVHPDGKKSLKLLVTYNFSVVGDSTDKGSLLRPA